MAYVEDGLDSVVLARLRRSIFAAAGLMVAVGCSARAVGPDDLGDDDAGDDASDGGDGEGDGGSTSGGDGGDGDGSAGSATATATATATADGGDDGPQAICVDDNDGFGTVLVCRPDDASCGSCLTECAALAGQIAEAQGDVPCGGWEDNASVLCSSVVDGQCCQLVQIYDIGCAGRPFVVGGQAQVADLASRSDWLAALAPSRAHELDGATRRDLAERWRAMAQAEHASVASFARFCLDLLSVGAPPSLLLATQRAMADEVEHARLCFAMATGYDGRDLGPAELPSAAAQVRARDLASIVADAAAEGCVEETISAALAAVAAERAEDPAVATVLRKIARDEERHAALAWSFVRWIVQARPELHVVIADAFARATATRPALAPADEADLAAHGMLDARTRALVANATCRSVIAPAAAALRSSRAA